MPTPLKPHPRKIALAQLMTVLLLVSVALWGCQQDKPLPPAQPAKIGVIFPIQGPGAATGSDLQAGVELALEVVNHAYDLDLPLAPGEGLTRHGIRLQAIYRDSGNDPTLAAQAAADLVRHDKVIALLGGYTSEETAAISEQAEILQVPLLNCTSTAPRLTQMGLQWFFRLTPDDFYFAQNFFQFLQESQANQPGSVPRRLALIYENGMWGTGVAQAQRKLAKKYGYDIVADIPYNLKGTSFEKVLAAHGRNLESKTIFCQASCERDAILLLRAYKAQHIQPTAILAMNAGFTSPNFIKALGSERGQIFSQEVWAQDIFDRKPLAALVNNLFRQRYGRDLTGNAASSFTGTIILAEALNRAVTLTPKAIREALRHTEIPAAQLVLPWQGVKFDPQTGQNLQGGGLILQLQQGAYRTVWPKDFAASQVVWPTADDPAPEVQP